MPVNYIFFKFHSLFSFVLFVLNLAFSNNRLFVNIFSEPVSKYFIILIVQSFAKQDHNPATTWKAEGNAAEVQGVPHQVFGRVQIKPPLNVTRLFSNT